MTRTPTRLSLWTCGTHTWWAPAPRHACPYPKCKTAGEVRYVSGPWKRQQAKKWVDACKALRDALEAHR